MYNVKNFGQVFTPDYIVAQMLQLRENYGSILEPSCGDGAFFKNIAGCDGIEIDGNICPKNALNIDFFEFSIENKYDTIIGNPPYVRYQDIMESTKRKLVSNLFDERSNLYLFFIEKCINHLNPNGELIFITPRDFLKATSSAKLNEFIFQNGTITEFIDLGDKKVFNGFTPNTAIWRFEKGNFTRKTNVSKTFTLQNGQLLFTDNHYPIKFNDIFFVKVGAVSGNDAIFTTEEHFNKEFVCSSTNKNGTLKKMLFNEYHPYLEDYKEQLLSRGIKEFNSDNWWMWGRSHYISKEKRIYVNSKTRNPNPFFVNDCLDYDGSILAIFPKDQTLDVYEICDDLNKVNWFELGFVCDGRFIFSQRSLENSILPDTFKKYIYSNKLF